jgi:hemoglobin
MQSGDPSAQRKLEPLCEKIGRQQMDEVIHAFYDKLRADAQLAGFFTGISDFPPHEAHIADFWWVAMGGKLDTPRQFDMLGLHRDMPLTEAAFERWLALFGATLVEHLPAEQAVQWLSMADGIGANLKRHTL